MMKCEEEHVFAPEFAVNRLIATLLVFLGLSGTAFAAPAALQGTPYYMDRMALPPNARVESVIFERGPRGTASRVFARGTEIQKADAPLIYRVTYDDARIRPDRRYYLEIRIRAPGGRVAYVTPAPVPVFNGETAATDRVLLRRVDGRSPVQPGSTRLTGSWLAENIRGGGVIDRLQSILQLDADGKVSGSGGCNRMMGKAQISGDTISFGAIASTQMACTPAAMSQERKFFDALAEAKFWRVDEPRRKLFLLDAQNNPLIVFSRM